MAIMTTTELIQVAVDEFVQPLPSVPKGTARNRYLFGQTLRGPLLDALGTRRREHQLLTYYRNDFNLLFRGTVSGLVKRIQSTPWEVQGDPPYAEVYQDVLLNADFGRGWDSFISKLLIDYSRADGGAYIEQIGPGDPTRPLVSGITGLATLDTMRCLPTGDPEYPTIYMDDTGTLHTLHHTRVVRFLDMPDGYELALGYGECALSRAIAAVYRDILINQYVQQLLDDNPPPGLVLFSNITPGKLQEAIAQMEKERGTDTGGTWGRSVRLYGLQNETKPEVEFVTYATTPEKFDFETYKNINVKEIALAFGLDVQEIWELTGGNIGTATQSEILHQKSKGKAIGRILKGLERIINQALPASISFEFQYQDPDEDQEQAALAQTWIGNAQLLQSMGASPQTIMQLLANQVAAIRDVVTDDEGQLRLPDVEMTPEEAGVITPDVEDMTPPDASVEEDKAKVLADTQREFRQGIIAIARSKRAGRAGVRTFMRAHLQQLAEKAAMDGLIDGGAEPVITTNLKRSISRWRTQQKPFIDKFVADLFDTEMSDAQVSSRADMWVNRSLNPVYYMGLAEAAPRQKKMWVMNPRKEHCDTCIRLNGQIHTLDVYVKSGFLPQSPILDCGGFKCGCGLKDVTGKSQGRLPKGTRLPGSALQNISNAIGRIFGGK